MRVVDGARQTWEYRAVGSFETGVADSDPKCLFQKGLEFLLGEAFLSASPEV